MIKQHVYKALNKSTGYNFVVSVVTVFWRKKPLFFNVKPCGRTKQRDIENIDMKHYIELQGGFLVDKTKFTEKYYKGKVVTK